MTSYTMFMASFPPALTVDKPEITSSIMFELHCKGASSSLESRQEIRAMDVPPNRYGFLAFLETVLENIDSYRVQINPN